jgi:hypothetical protein
MELPELRLVERGRFVRELPIHVLEYSDVSPLAWDEKDLVEPVTVRRLGLLDDPIPRRAFCLGLGPVPPRG